MGCSNKRGIKTRWHFLYGGISSGGRDADIQYREYSWNHSISEVLNALIRHGLTIQHFNEFSYSCYNCFNNMVQGEDGYWRVNGLENKLPMMYSVKAVKAASV